MSYPKTPKDIAEQIDPDEYLVDMYEPRAGGMRLAYATKCFNINDAVREVWALARRLKTDPEWQWHDEHADMSDDPFSDTEDEPGMIYPTITVSVGGWRSPDNDFIVIYKPNKFLISSRKPDTAGLDHFKPMIDMMTSKFGAEAMSDEELEAYNEFI